MSGTTSPTAGYVDATGFHTPTFDTILSYLQGQVQTIFGADTYLGNDSQDGQLLGIFATAIYDTNSMAVAVYNSYRPGWAAGVGLSSIVKINGIARNLPTFGTVDLVITGVAGTIITNGVATDQAGNQWEFSTTIPVSGQITVTAQATISGNVVSQAGSVTTIQTPVLGWQSVTNPQASVAGLALESDPQLRVRQTHSTMQASVTALDGIIGAVLSLPGVTRLQAYENDTSVTDANGIPSHSISLVVEGGDAQAIANTIAARKTPGAGTYGTTSETVIDAYGIPHVINFFLPTGVPVNVTVHLTALTGYTSIIGNEVVAAVTAYLNANPIGQGVYVTKVIAAALSGIGADAQTFNLTSLLMWTGTNVPAQADINILFNQVSTAGSITVAIP